MNSPTHEAITRCAREIWQARGNPAGDDTSIWLEAERQLTRPSSPDDGTIGSGLSLPVAVERASSHQPDLAATASDPLEVAAKATSKKKASRAPKLPNHSAPRSAPTESGKPLWDKPHSS